ncbi:hypothetical protein CBER1_10941 [Cercospora berteroae]|uniref:Uncharacterized protein n=1 Tax=Cercospora berteroae TaxID=357750 RepID=A0A2S6CNE7_9PEZI|nr:hypothetical protein CBER1_10941 [Cercospora berteroae]
MDVAIKEVLAKEQVVKDMSKELKALISAPETTQQARKVCCAKIERTALEGADDEPGIGMTPERAAKITELERELAEGKERLQQSESEVVSLRQQLDRAQS